MGEARARRKIEEIVMALTREKATNQKKDTSALEDELNKIVYRLYGLAPNEINLVEAFDKAN